MRQLESIAPAVAAAFVGILSLGDIGRRPFPVTDIEELLRQYHFTWIGWVSDPSSPEGKKVYFIERIGIISYYQVRLNEW